MLKLRVAGIGLLAALVVVAAAGVVVFRAVDSGSSASAAPGAQQQQEKPWLGVLFARTPDGLTIAQVIADSPADIGAVTQRVLRDRGLL